MYLALGMWPDIVLLPLMDERSYWVIVMLGFSPEWQFSLSFGPWWQATDNGGDDGERWMSRYDGNGWDGRMVAGETARWGKMVRRRDGENGMMAMGKTVL